MPSIVDYARFAENSYAVSRDVVKMENEISIASGWSLLEDRSIPATGFLARAYKNTTTNEIVIAYTGTTSEDGMKTVDWMNGNLPASTGFGLGGQVVNAAKFYLDILNAPENNGCNISFTGHSLGGGLASLMAVYFNKPAETFDQAPFGRTAVSQNIYDALKDRLIQLNYMLPADFVSYVPGSDMSGREGLVGETHIKGEAMQVLENQWLMGGVLAAVGGIVGVLTDLLFAPYNIARNGTAGEKNIGGDGDLVSLHYGPLILATLQSDKFRQACKDNPGFLQQIFDSKFYSEYTQDTEKRNFFNLMCQQEIAGNKPLDALADDIAKFTGDLDPVASGKAGADGALKSALYALAVALYYNEAKNRIGTEGNPIAPLFESISGGIRFTPDPDPNAKTDYDASLKAVIKQLQGYFPEVGAYLNVDADRYTLPTTGNLTVPAIGDDKRDLMLGSRQNDNLQGGGGNDTLLGLVGNDTLDGGAGDDTLLGGTGNDTYVFKSGDGADTIVDANGGILQRDGSTLSLGVRTGDDMWQADGGNIIYTRNGSDLLIECGGDSITLRNFDFDTAIVKIDNSLAPYTLPPKLDSKAFDIQLDNGDIKLISGVANAGTTPAKLSEGGASVFTAYVSAPTDYARSFKLKLTGSDCSKFSACNGADILSFASGEVTLTIPAGQTAATFAILSTGDIDANASDRSDKCIYIHHAIRNTYKICRIFNRQASNEPEWRIAA